MVNVTVQDSSAEAVYDPAAIQYSLAIRTTTFLLTEDGVRVVL